jgi:hypothetical protein
VCVYGYFCVGAHRVLGAMLQEKKAQKVGLPSILTHRASTRSTHSAGP